MVATCFQNSFGKYITVCYNSTKMIFEIIPMHNFQLNLVLIVERYSCCNIIFYSRLN